MKKLIFFFIISILLGACSHSLDDYLEKGREYGAKGDIKAAYDYYTHIIKRAPNSPEAAVALQNRGAILYGKGKLRRAIADIDRSLKMNNYTKSTLPPAEARAIGYYYRGSIYVNAGRPLEGLDDLSMAIELSPHFAPAYLSRGDLNFFLGNIEQAKDDYVTAVAYAKDSATADTALAHLKKLNEHAKSMAGSRKGG